MPFMHMLGIALIICTIVSLVGVFTLCFTDNGSKWEDRLCKITLPFMVVAILIILYTHYHVAVEKERKAAETYVQ